MITGSPILSVRELRTHFATAAGVLRAVDGVSFDLERGKTLAIVGESGSGKTVANLSLLRLVPQFAEVSGEVVFDGRDLLTLPEKEIRRIRGRRIAMIFQDPMASLNPYLRVSAQLAEITRLHLGLTNRQARDHGVEMLRSVGIPDPETRFDGYPHELSGGMRQRVMIAMALSCGPEVLIADEPTTALDVTIQSQILDLLNDLKTRKGSSLILVTHDLGVVAGMADHVVVMYAGKLVEKAPTRSLFGRPAHPYTRGLLQSIPDPSRAGRTLHQIPGLPPDIGNLPPGCPFAERCERAEDICRSVFPPLVDVGPEHSSWCHFAEDVHRG